MNSSHAFWVLDCQTSNNKGAPVTSLNNILFISKLGHDLVHDLSMVNMLETSLVGIRRKSIARK